jgi:hydroxymethylglutaryl-CoA reductase
MRGSSLIGGFSGLSRQDKIRAVAAFTDDPERLEEEMQVHVHTDKSRQKLYEEFTENAVSNYFLPYSIAPNFRINGKEYLVPMVTEESSVVAAAASAAKFWWPLGGFRGEVLEMDKPGHIHFLWRGSRQNIAGFIRDIMPGLLDVLHPVTRNMNSRNGGVRSIQLKDMSDSLEAYYQLEVVFNTSDAMGANFINTCLETMAGYMQHQAGLRGMSDQLEIIMSILSNYTPGCTVKCSVSCGVEDLSVLQDQGNGLAFALKFETAVKIAQQDVYRAVTHNKGIYNGVDAVLIATGNDFRAAEAAGHAWAAKDGQYRGLTKVDLKQDVFTCSIEIPLSVGVVGGLTRSHPLAAASLSLLGNPGAGELMAVAAAVGLANNFSAVRALITGGIQQGHMRMHMQNILNQLGATEAEKKEAAKFFERRTISHAGISAFIEDLRSKNA